MPKFSAAFCVTPLQPIDKYPMFIEHVSHEGVELVCKSTEIGNGLHVYTNKNSSYVWYSNMKRYSRTEISYFHKKHRSKIIKMITEFIKENFNYDQPLKILFSVYDFSKIASERLIKSFLLEKIVIEEIIAGEYDKYSIWDDDTEKKASKIIPPLSNGVRSWTELIDKMRESNRDQQYIFFCPSQTIINFLPYYYAKEFLNESHTYNNWDNHKRIPYTPKNILYQIVNLYYHLCDAIENKREIEISKNFTELKTYCWLFGDDTIDDLNDPIEMKNYVKFKYLTQNL
jgi:hypothetical protein